MVLPDTLIFYRQSPYQKISFFTEGDGSYSLTLDDYWQFNSRSEHIYHECLFALPALFPEKLKKVLILGGGDGLGVRELLRYKSIHKIDLVDLDPDMVNLAKLNPHMRKLNESSMTDPRVNITIADAKDWLSHPVSQKYDLIIVDFPDPTSKELWDLYTIKVYKQLVSRLEDGGVIAIQGSTYNTNSYRKIFDRLNKVFPFILGYHTATPSIFCGFFILSFFPVKIHRSIPNKCKYLTPNLANQLLGLPLL